MITKSKITVTPSVTATGTATVGTTLTSLLTSRVVGDLELKTVDALLHINSYVFAVTTAAARQARQEQYFSTPVLLLSSGDKFLFSDGSNLIIEA
jgi:hypothetical protein